MATGAAARIRVLTVDDHPILRDGIVGILAAHADISVVAEAADGIEAIAQFRQHRPDVTLMDLQMPRMGGLEALQAIFKEFPDARIVVLTTYKGDVQAVQALKRGAAGYMLKSLVRLELPDIIRSVHAGRRYIPPELAVDIAEHAGEELLSDRELKILRLVATGHANKQIAWTLAMAEDTVKAHLKNIFAKLDASDRTHAVTKALQRGFIQI